MLRNVFFKSLRDQQRPLIRWVIGAAFYIALLMSIYPSIRHSAGQLQGYIHSLPAAVRVAFLGSNGDFSSPVGYVNVELLSWLAPVVLIAFAVATAARALAGEEEDGTLSLLLAQPISRRRLLLQKYAAMLVAVTILGLAFWLALAVSTWIVGTPLGAGKLGQALLRLTLLGLAVGSITFAVGSATGRRQGAIAWGTGVGGAMYLLNTLAQINSAARPFRYLSLFHYSGSPSPLGQGLGAPDLLALIGTSALLLLVAAALFERRDVRV
ncbi:MAG: ABC transporter permease subunit [Thermoleophilia bacterium]|jgi:ABC-2 type transport system permease protein